MRWLTLAALLLCECASPSSAADSLESSVRLYNDGLRWQRFAQASRFVPKDLRAEFMRRALGSEETLHIESLEVRAVTPVEQSEPAAFDVTVVAELYRLPSTVLEKIVLTERWEQRGDGFVITASTPELLPR